MLRPMSVSRKCSHGRGVGGGTTGKRSSWVTNKEGAVLAVCPDGKIVGISGINKELAVPDWLCYPRSMDLYVLKGEGPSGTRNLPWGERGLSDALSLTYPQDSSVPPSEW